MYSYKSSLLVPFFLGPWSEADQQKKLKLSVEKKEGCLTLSLLSVFKSNNWYNLYRSEMAVSNTLRFCFSIIVGCSCDDYPYDIIEYPKYKMIIRKYYIPLVLDTPRLTDSIN